MNSHVVYQTPSSINSRKRATSGDDRNEFSKTIIIIIIEIIVIII